MANRNDENEHKSEYKNERKDTESNAQTERIVAARLRLMERFQDKQANSPSVADPRPQGSGPTNRHGMPKLPVGQTETKKWPVLDLGITPHVQPSDWHLTIDGHVRNPVTLRWEDFLHLEQIDDISDFHCVTTWSRFDVPWRGVRFSTIAALADPHDDAFFVMCYGADGYSTNLSLDEALKNDVLLVHTADNEPLSREHGGPVRMITPQLYAWKGAKWINRIEFMRRNRRGFWELRGYSDTAYPWRNDRYS